MGQNYIGNIIFSRSCLGKMQGQNGLLYASSLWFLMQIGLVQKIIEIRSFKKYINVIKRDLLDKKNKYFKSKSKRNRKNLAKEDKASD